MSLTTVATTATPMSETSSASLSTVPTPTTKASSASPTSSVISTPSSTNDPPTTSTPGSSIQPSALSTVTPSTTTQAQTPSSAPATSERSATSSAIPISTTPLASDVLSTSSTSSSTPSFQGSSLEGSGIPLTTVLESTTLYVTGTNSQGQVVTSVPPVVTEVITTTGSGGIATTVTQAIVNPTLASDDSTTGGSSFFNDTGAVVGVFVVVGLASASILMWMLFAIRHRQRMRRIEQDTVIEAAVAAAGLNRAPLDDGDESDSPISPNTRQFSSGTDQRVNFLSLGGSGSLPTSTRLSEGADDPARGSSNSHQGFHVEHRTRSHPEGYIPARTTSPLPPSGRFTDDLGSSRDRKSSYGHTPTYSAGSFEPLLANYAPNTVDQDAHTVPSQNPSSQRPNSGLGPHSSDETPENGSRTSQRRRNSSNGSVLQEDEFAHYVLMVRNIPDDHSQHSE